MKQFKNELNIVDFFKFLTTETDLFYKKLIDQAEKEADSKIEKILKDESFLRKCKKHDIDAEIFLINLRKANSSAFSILNILDAWSSTLDDNPRSLGEFQLSSDELKFYLNNPEEDNFAILATVLKTCQAKGFDLEILNLDDEALDADAGENILIKFNLNSKELENLLLEFYYQFAEYVRGANGGAYYTTRYNLGFVSFETNSDYISIY